MRNTLWAPSAGLDVGKGHTRTCPDLRATHCPKAHLTGCGGGGGGAQAAAPGPGALVPSRASGTMLLLQAWAPDSQSGMGWGELNPLRDSVDFPLATPRATAWPQSHTGRPQLRADTGKHGALCISRALREGEPGACLHQVGLSVPNSDLARGVQWGTTVQGLMAGTDPVWARSSWSGRLAMATLPKGS